MWIRTAVLQDFDAIARVRIDTWRQAYAGIIAAETLADLSYEATAQRWRSYFLNNSPPGWFTLVAEETAGQVIGFASGGPERSQDASYAAEIYALYLLPEYQRRGIGRRLVAAAAVHLCRSGYKNLLIWVLEQNPACAFYEALGGRIYRRRQIEIGGQWLPEVAYVWEELKALEMLHRQMAE